MGNLIKEETSLIEEIIELGRILFAFEEKYKILEIIEKIHNNTNLQYAEIVKSLNEIVAKAGELADSNDNYGKDIACILHKYAKNIFKDDLDIECKYVVIAKITNKNTIDVFLEYAKLYVFDKEYMIPKKIIESTERNLKWYIYNIYGE